MAPSRYAKSLRACSEELTPLLTRLMRQHSALTVLAALTEHLSGALVYCRGAGIMTNEDVRAVLTRVRRQSSLTRLHLAPGASSERPDR
jgi:hypothetical protein